MIVKDGAREAPKPRGMVGDPLAWGLIIRETIALLLVFVFQERDEILRRRFHRRRQLRIPALSAKLSSTLITIYKAERQRTPFSNCD